VLGPEGTADPEVPIRLAEAAVRSATETAARANCLTTLGAALYRAGRFAEAATVAESNDLWDGAGLDRLVLAMSRQRLGQAAAARAALAEAVHWRAARPDLRPDRAAAFDRLLREARSVLDGTLPDLPADVFAR